MISAKFFHDKSEDKITGFSIQGHSEDAEFGESLLCAAISAISQTTVNGLLEIAKANLKTLDISDGYMLVMLGESESFDEKSEFAAQVLLKNLELGIRSLELDAPRDIKIVK